MSRMRKTAFAAVASLSFCTCLIPAVYAGVTNPDISVIGQIISQKNDNAASENANTATLNLGETELVCDAWLNPYARGFFVFTIGTDGLATEEAYVAIIKGLPGTLNLKGGQYRVGFGKLNPVHPHAYPFIEAPRVLAAMLPGGEDGFNDVGVQGSVLLPSAGSWASNLSVDVLNGASFHPDETKAAAGWVGRWSNSLLINDEVPLELGASATGGNNNVQWKTGTNVYGADIKTRIPFSALTNLTFQSEYFYNNSEVVVDSTTGSFNTMGRQGFYTFADLRFWQRCNAGVIYDQYQPSENSNFTDRAVKLFAGYALLEETTIFRLSYEQFLPEAAPVVHTFMFQVLFSMGPHKPHLF